MLALACPEIYIPALSQPHCQEQDARQDQLGDVSQQGRVIAPAARILRDQQDPLDDRRARNFLEALSYRGAEPHRGKRRLDNVGRAQVAPILFGKLAEGDLPVPVGE